MAKSELVQKLCNMHPSIFRKDVEKIVDIIILEIVFLYLENAKVCPKH